jgi:hypothetical protein
MKALSNALSGLVSAIPSSANAASSNTPDFAWTVGFSVKF